MDDEERTSMTVNLTGALLAGSIWMLAAVVASPWEHPAVAAALLIGQAVGYIALALLDGAPSLPLFTGHRPRGRP